MSSKKNKLKALQDGMHMKLDKFPDSPLICNEFGGALFEISRFARITLESYSTEGKRFGANIKRKNRKLKKTDYKLSLYSAKADTMAAIVIPNFYYLCQIAIWGILEEFLRDALFLVITENISDTNKTRGKEVRRINIQKEELVNLVIERGRNNIGSLNKLYKNLLKIDLKENKKFSELFDMRNKRNVIAHSGFLFGYDSLTKKKNKTKSFEEEILNISDSAGMEFINAESIIDDNGKEMLPDSWYSYDPTETKSSYKLEQDFCHMVELVWELGYFISKKLFVKKTT